MSKLTKQQNVSKRELRLNPISRRFEVRKNSDGSRSIFGEAVVYSSLSEDLGFREVIRPGAFTEFLKSDPDLLLLYGHDENKVCARVSNSSLQIDDTPTALRFSATLPNDVSWVNDLVALLESDLVGGMSFGFRCLEDKWTDTGDYLLREVITAEIFEISVVPSWPAYSATSVDLRSVPPAIKQLLSLRAKQTQKTKTVDGIQLPATSFAFVGDPEKPDNTWKLPIYFPGDEEKTVDHIKDALARFNQTEGIPQSEQAHIYSKIVGAAKAHGIKVTAEKLEDRDWDDNGWEDDDSEDDQTDATDPMGDDDDDDLDDDEQYSRAAAALLAARLRR